MAQQTYLDDVAQWWGNDLQLSPTGDLARVNRVDRSNQRVLRRLCTNPGDYTSHPTYGGGLPGDIGQNLDVKGETGKISGQMLLEASVAQSPPPAVTVLPMVNGASVQVAYTVLPDKQPAALSFDVSP